MLRRRKLCLAHEVEKCTRLAAFQLALLLELRHVRLHGGAVRLGDADALGQLGDLGGESGHAVSELRALRL